MKLFKSLFFSLFIILTANSINNACTNIIVTKGASSNNSVMISYAADSYGFYGELYHYKGGFHPKGSMRQIYNWDNGKYLGKIPEAEITYNVVGNINEHQVVIGETTFGGRRELRNKDGLLDYGSLIYITLQRATSAKDAIKIMTDLVAEYGYCSGGESFSIGDKNDAWILEMIGKGEGNKGAVWVARKIPDGMICAHANQARITTFPLDDPENCLYSEDIISFAREMEFFNGKDEEFNFTDAYAPLSFGGIRYCDARVWSVFRRAADGMDKYKSYINAESLDRMPLWVEPKVKLSLHDVMSLMRDHYEGTDMDMSKGVAAGLYNSPYRCSPLSFTVDGEKYFNERPISTYQTAWTYVSQSRNDLPDAIGGVLWFGLDDTYMTVYTPMYCSMLELPDNYKEGVASITEFSWDSAFWVFNAVSNFVYPRWSLVIDEFQRKQSELEGEYIYNQKSVEEKAINLYKSSPRDAVEYLTNYSKAAGKNTHDTWIKFFNHLNMKYTDGVIKDEFGKPKRVGYSKETLAAMAAEGGEAIKVKELPNYKDASYNKKIKEAKKSISNREYAEALKLYKEALEIKSENTEAKTEIEKLETVISTIEELHKSNFGK